jgi:hypothetical protein
VKTPSEVRGAPSLAGRRIDLRWEPPPAGDFAPAAPLDGVRVVRRERTFPLAPDDGDVVYEGAVVSALSDRGLAPLRTYYYTVFAREHGAPPVYHADDGSRIAVFATESFDLAERLYGLLPAVHLRHDTPLTPPEIADLAASNPTLPAALDALPAPLRNAGQLRRLLHTIGSPADLMRSFAEGLRQLHDADVARPEFLPLLADLVGWELDRTLPIFSQRNEVKFAPPLYRSVGTVPNIRAMVNRATGWHTQVAEFAQHVARSNEPAQLNLFALVEDGGAFTAADDAASVLGFPLAPASGGAGTPAMLAGAVVEPFTLRPGMELAVAADDRLPVVVRFRPGDFADIGSATAAEVAAVLERVLSEVAARAVGGAVELRSHTVGTQSALRVERYDTTLVTLEGAPGGRPAALRDADGRLRLVYETADPLEPVRRHATAVIAAGAQVPRGLAPGRNPQPAPGSLGTRPVELASEPAGRVRLKTLRGGAWGPSLTLPTAGAAGSPAVGVLPDGRIAAAWVEAPGGAAARIRFALGTTQTPRAARLRSTRGEPFRIEPGSRLVLSGTWPAPEAIEFVAGDFADPASATAAEVRTALQARLTGVTTSIDAGTIVLETTVASGDERLEVDVASSTAAPALGFGEANASARGDWGDELLWTDAVDVAPPGRLADLGLLVETGGAVRIFWAAHVDRAWRIEGARWDGAALPPTFSAPAVAAADPGGSREPFPVLGEPGRLWLVWAARTGVGTTEDIWTLQRRVLDLATQTWGVPAALTTAAAPRSADREPAAVPLPGGDIRVFFRSDRSGGAQVWSLTVTPSTGVVTTPPAPVTAGPYAGAAPAPVRDGGGRLWLLYRSDRSVPLSRVGLHQVPPGQNRIALPQEPTREPTGPLASVAAPDTGTLRRYAGSTTVVPDDLTRLRRRRLFGDALAYTPQGTSADTPLLHDELYTRGTLGLYLSPLIPDDPLTEHKRERVGAVLTRFLAANERAVVILAPRFDVEFLYVPVDIGESYHDDGPEIDVYAGVGEALVVAAVPGLALFLSALPPGPPVHLSADPARPQTFHSRTWFPPPL